jgi:hypothetical protein
MEKASISIRMARNMKETGNLTNRMESEKKRGLMELYSKDSTLTVRNTEKESSSGTITRSMKDNFKRIL